MRRLSILRNDVILENYILTAHLPFESKCYQGHAVSKYVFTSGTSLVILDCLPRVFCLVGFPCCQAPLVEFRSRAHLVYDMSLW
jgi:hypothetical protein